MFSRTFILCLVVVGMVPVPARAQSSTATLSGTVVDGNAAALPGTKVTAVNVETGQRREAISTSDGTFTIPLLQPGRYSVTAVREGFSPTEIRDIVLNTTAFVQNPAGTFGTSRRNMLRGPGYANVDIGLFKDFRGLRSSHKIQFRGEVFNLFNRQNLGNPDANLSSPGFGRITNTVGDPRVIQLALKYVF